MSHRIKFTDNRWFADYRPVCIVENELKKNLGAKDEDEYAKKLQTNGLALFNATIRRKPVISVKATTGSNLLPI